MQTHPFRHIEYFEEKESILFDSKTNQTELKITLFFVLLQKL